MHWSLWEQSGYAQDSSLHDKPVLKRTRPLPGEWVLTVCHTPPHFVVHKLVQSLKHKTIVIASDTTASGGKTLHKAAKALGSPAAIPRKDNATQNVESQTCNITENLFLCARFFCMETSSDYVAENQFYSQKIAWRNCGNSVH